MLFYRLLGEQYSPQQIIYCKLFTCDKVRLLLLGLCIYKYNIGEIHNDIVYITEKRLHSNVRKILRVSAKDPTAKTDLTRDASSSQSEQHTADILSCHGVQSMHNSKIYHCMLLISCIGALLRDYTKSSTETAKDHICKIVDVSPARATFVATPAWTN